MEPTKILKGILALLNVIGARHDEKVCLMAMLYTEDCRYMMELLEWVFLNFDTDNNQYPTMAEVTHKACQIYDKIHLNKN